MGDDSPILVLGGPLGRAGASARRHRSQPRDRLYQRLLNKWNNTFYDALQDKNYTVFLHQLIRFSWLAGLLIVFAVYQFYLNQMLQIRWRSWLTEHYLRGWLTEGAYYRMQFVALPRPKSQPDICHESSVEMRTPTSVKGH